MILDRKVGIFLKVARDGGFPKAARGQGLSQSSVSFHIDRLEEELDVQLFHRQGRTISLTQEGRFLFEELESLEREARRVKNRFALHSNVLGRQIRAGSNTLACPYTLPWVIQSFGQEHPEVVFTYKHMGNEQELIELLVVGDLDIGVLVTLFDTRSSLRTGATRAKSSWRPRLLWGWNGLKPASSRSCPLSWKTATAA